VTRERCSQRVSFTREGCECNDPELDVVHGMTAIHNAQTNEMQGLPTLDPVELAAEEVALRAAHEQLPTEPDADTDVAED